MRWTSKHLWLVALGAGLVAWPAWAQSSRDYDDDSGSRSSSRQYDDESSSPSSREGRQSSRQYDYDTDDDSSGRSASRSESRSRTDSSSRRSSSQGEGSRNDRDDSSWSRSGADRSSRNRQRDRSGESWFGMDGQYGQSSQEEQWSNWDYEKDIDEPNVWRVSNLIGKNVQNSRGEDLGEIEDIVIDTQNKSVRYAAVSYGGALGFGEKLFAVPLDRLSMQKDEDGEETFVLNIDQDTLENVQGFEERQNWPAQADASLGRRQSQTARSGQQGGSQQSGQRSFRGEFEDYDEDGEQIVVRTSDGRRRVYNVSPSVRVTSDGERAFLDELEEGTQVRLSYTTDRNNRTTITAVDETSSSRVASRSRGQSYNSASYDPNEQDRWSSQQDRSRESRRQDQYGSQRESSGYESSSANYETDVDDNRSSNRRSSDYGDGGSRMRSSERSYDESSSDDSDDDRSSRSSSRNSDRSRSSSEYDNSGFSSDSEE